MTNRLNRLNRYELIKSRLEKQIDILEILRWLRIFQFVTVTNIRKNQSELVSYFEQFNLQKDDTVHEKEAEQRTIE